jgi:hypothetical protein
MSRKAETRSQRKSEETRIMATSIEEITRRTEAVFARRMEVVLKMYEGKASYDEVLAFHAEDFIWMSPMGTTRGHEAARALSAQRQARMPPEALQGLKIIQTAVIGEYAFQTFKTDLIPFGTDTYIIRDGKIVFQSNALYIPRDLRELLR